LNRTVYVFGKWTDPTICIWVIPSAGHVDDVPSPPCIAIAVSFPPPPLPLLLLLADDATVDVIDDKDVTDDNDGDGDGDDVDTGERIGVDVVDVALRVRDKGTKPSGVNEFDSASLPDVTNSYNSAIVT
jgi:hypothetical protein